MSEYLGKLTFSRSNFIKQKEELEQKLIEQKKINIKNQIKNKKELEQLIKSFLRFDQIDKIDLYRLIHKIEIDKDKRIYLYFAFSKPNFIDKNLEGTIKSS